MKFTLRETDCSFCDIVSGNDQSIFVFKNDIAVAFLDNHPLFYGHTLLVPRAHVETIADLPEELTGEIFRIVRQLAIAVQAAMEGDGTFIGINNKVSQSVAHLHIHIVPRKQGDGLRGFFWPRKRYDTLEVKAAIREKIKERIKLNAPKSC